MSRVCRPRILLFGFMTLAAGMILAAGCSPDIQSYDELARTGTLEQTIRKVHKPFFDAVSALDKAAGNEDVSPDSALVAHAAHQTDAVVNAMDAFPGTVAARLAFDALSIAAEELIASPNFSHPGIRAFWETGLLIPLYQAGYRFMTEHAGNEAAHLQVLRGLKRGIGDHATDRMLMDAMPILGVTPSDSVMAFCNADTLMFKRIHDLIIYARSRQETDPPLWLLSGKWLLAIAFEDTQPFFIVLSPHITNATAFLAFCDQNMGDVYAAIFDDPVPQDEAKWDAWLVRANAVMSTLSFDSELAERVRASSLTARNAHYFYDDYLVHTTGDTLKRELYLSFSRQRTKRNEFEHTGKDSIVVTFNEVQIVNPDGTMTALQAHREVGSSLVGGQLYLAESHTGTAYLMPIGVHDPAIVAAYRQQLRESLGVPEFSVSFEPSAP